MIELTFATEGEKVKFRCSTCPESVSRSRRCAEPGYNQLKGGIPVTKHGRRFEFCPGKATWSEDIADLYRKCFIAYSTGILPSRGGYEDQDALFCDVFDTFVRSWSARRYHQVWGDVRDYVEAVLKQVLGKKK